MTWALTCPEMVHSYIYNDFIKLSTQHNRFYAWRSVNPSLGSLLVCDSLWVALAGTFSHQWALTNTHTHTHLTALCPGLPRWAGTRKVKPIWILLEQETMSGSGISWAICKSAPRSRQITTPALHYSSFSQAGCPSCHPTNSVKALKELKYNCTVNKLQKTALCNKQHSKCTAQGTRSPTSMQQISYCKQAVSWRNITTL